MDHSELENELNKSKELRVETNFLYEKLEKFIRDKYGFQLGYRKSESTLREKDTTAKKAGWASNEEAMLYKNNSDRSEFLKQEQIIIELCKTNTKCGQAFNKRLRLKALKRIQMDVKNSIERCDKLISNL
jgi:hypothetical protein